jgi:5-methyltetrahydropteroyltriglutamate--homocysteine methyltransferase
MSLRRDSPPFRADHVGSLLRPAWLLQARQDHAEGRLDAEELRGTEDAAIREVVRLQEEIGLRSATDGEFRRASWHMDFIYQLGGISKVVDTSLTVEFRTRRGRSGSPRRRSASAAGSGWSAPSSATTSASCASRSPRPRPS